MESNRGDAQGGFQRSVLKPLLWGEPPAFGGVGGTFPAPALPPQGETGKGESNQNSLLPQAITYWLMPESALSPQPPNSLEPLEARHSQFLKRVKPASLGGTNGCTQSGPPMLTIQAKPTYITYSCSQPEKDPGFIPATLPAHLPAIDLLADLNGSGQAKEFGLKFHGSHRCLWLG